MVTVLESARQRGAPSSEEWVGREGCTIGGASKHSREKWEERGSRDMGRRQVPKHSPEEWVGRGSRGMGRRQVPWTLLLGAALIVAHGLVTPAAGVSLDYIPFWMNYFDSECTVQYSTVLQQ